MTRRPELGPVEVAFLGDRAVVFTGRAVSTVCVLHDVFRRLGVDTEWFGERVLVAHGPRSDPIDVALDLGLWLVPQESGTADGLASR
ncbi:MAG TPA: hypothetical protein VGC37_18885 [Friedmanniella sp.]